MLDRFKNDPEIENPNKNSPEKILQSSPAKLLMSSEGGRKPYRPPSQPQITNMSSLPDEQLNKASSEDDDCEADADLSQSLLSLNKIVGKYLAAPSQES